MFYYDYVKDKKILKSDLITEVNAFFTTRDLIIKSNDEKYNLIIKNNKQVISEYLGITVSKLISPQQTHSDNINVFEDEKSEYLDTDALILDKKNYGIFLNFADCTPIILYDKKNKIGAISHAGWRGTAQKIAPKTVLKMQQLYNSKPEDIAALIGPAISLCCYNVGSEVLNKLRSTVSDFANLYKFVDKQIYVDLKNINRKQLEDIGITNVDVCPYCTVCDNANYFSYRKENGTTNRHSAVLCLN